jgi:AraC-like DNA-binding protein
VDRIDDSALRLRSLMERTPLGEGWVEDLFSDLTHTLGAGLPEDLRGFSRRILEFPGRYSSLGRVGAPFGLSAGALKARFRRRGLPPASRYVRWFRLLSASRILADPEATILSASMRLGFASDGNFCRWVRATSGLNPSAFRAWNGRLLLLVRMVDACFPPGAVERWASLRGLFLRQVA